MNRIVLIHGMWGHANTLASVAKFFRERGFQVECAELPGRHRHSPPPELGSYSLSEYCEFLIEAARIDENCLLLGHSMGGLLAQMIACRISVRGLILLASAGPEGTNCFHLKSAISTCHAWCRWRFWARPQKPPRWVARFALWNQMPASKIDELYEQLTWESGRAFFETVFWMFDGRRTIDLELDRITPPTLMIAGARDQIIVPSISNKLARRLPNCEYHLMPNHAHWLFDEPDNKPVYQHIENWLERNRQSWPTARPTLPAVAMCPSAKLPTPELATTG